MRCAHCPAPTDELCRGEATGHFCRLVDPADTIYTPAYVRILVRDDHVVDPLAPLDLSGLKAAASGGATDRIGPCGAPCP